MHKISIGTFTRFSNIIDNIKTAIDSGMLSTGTYIDMFENDVAKVHNKKYGVMVNSGQSALEVAIEMAKKKIGIDKLTILVPSTTYAATIWAIKRSGCVPKFCDINANYTIDYSLLDNRALKGVHVIMPVDLCGMSAKPPKYILDNYFVIQDACEAFGNVHACYGDIICHSFYVSHIITTGSGGMVLCNDKKLIGFARRYISHGRRYGGDFTKFTDKWVDRFIFDDIGASYRSSNIDAAIGYSQLEFIHDIINKRKENANLLASGLNADKNIDKFLFIPDENYINRCIFQFFPLLIKYHSFDRNRFLKYLYKNNIDSRVLLSLTDQPAFIKEYGDIQSKYKMSEYCNKYGFIIGCHQDITEQEIEYVVDIISKYSVINGK